jgi:hypothetical protein
MPLDNLLTGIRQNWNKQDLQANLKSAVANFPRDIFDDLSAIYENMDIASSMQITEFDLLSLEDVSSPDDLRLKIENIKKKFFNLKSHLVELQA